MTSPAKADAPKKKPAVHKTATTTKAASTKAPKAVKASDNSASVFIQTVGRRKRAVARLRFMRTGSGKITVNGKDYKEYFPYKLWQEVITSPLPQVGMDGVVDLSVKIQGGGIQAQSEAIRLALSRALVEHNPDWRPILRKMGWLTRDPREKERKKPGLKRARRAPQWQKR